MLVCWPYLASNISPLAQSLLSSLAPLLLWALEQIWAISLSLLSKNCLLLLRKSFFNRRICLHVWACMWACACVPSWEIAWDKMFRSRSGYSFLFLFPAIPIVYWTWDADNYSGVRWSSSWVSLLPTGLENIPLPFLSALSSPREAKF